jgi:hypothetical protein
VMMINNRAPLVTGLRSYFAWVQGSDWSFYDNVAVNSTREHIIRIGGAERIAIAGNTFANLDRRTVDGQPDPHDTAKGTLTIQKGRLAFVSGNHLTGPMGVGPLGKNDGLTDKSARFDGAVVQGNTIVGNVEVKHGAANVRCMDNRILSDGGIAFSVEGFSDAYGRGTETTLIRGNQVFNPGTAGNFVRIDRGAAGVRLHDNQYVAPNLVPGAYLSAAVYIEGDDARAIAASTGNIWPAAKPNSFAEGGVNYVWPAWADSRGYLDAREWNALPAVGDDAFKDLPLPADLKDMIGGGK